MKNFIDNIYRQKSDFIILGLTGKTGSGCTTIADILSNGYTDYNALNSNDKHIQHRKDSIIKNFAKHNLNDKKFQIIKPSTIIMMLFIFEKSIFFNQIKILKSMIEKSDEEEIKEKIQDIRFSKKTDINVDCNILLECKVSHETKVKKEC